MATLETTETTEASTDIDMSYLSPLSLPAQDLAVSESNARAMLRILLAEFKANPKIVFSPRVKSLDSPANAPCYYPQTLMTLPTEKSGLLTEGRVLHALAHVLNMEAHRPRPHGKDFADYLMQLEGAWWGGERAPRRKGQS